MKKEKKVKKTGKEKAKTALKVILIIVGIIAVIYGVLTCINIVGSKSNAAFVENSIKPVEYTEQLVPTADEEGTVTFTTDRDFKVVQLTDIHLGSGFLSIRKDNMALNASAAMITAEKPDLVVVTGDIAYPVPFQAGTNNNKRSAVVFADMMEKLGVYWCLTYGNHDTEAYSTYTREEISEIYSNKEKYPHCLFSAGPENIEGCGNYVINVKSSAGKITQSLFMIDSHSYTDNDYFGILWKYDCVHENQIKWLEEKIKHFTELNGGETPKSVTFMHIPVIEMREAFYELRDNDMRDTANVKYLGGKNNEKNLVVFSSEKNEGLFDACLNSGSVQAMFFGHDHLNNMSLSYKGMYLGYSYSVDYLAYVGIQKYGAQRGCSVITFSPDGSFDCVKENYYQEKYQSVNAKEAVTMEDYNQPEDFE